MTSRNRRSWTSGIGPRTARRSRADRAADAGASAFAGAPLSNQLLAGLPDPQRRRLVAHLEPVHLDRQQVIVRAHDTLTSVYFPTTAVVSLVTRVESGQTLEVGVIGRDGVVGAAPCPGVTTMACDAVANIAGAAHRLDANILRHELTGDAALVAAFSRYAELLMRRCMQLAACNMFHSVEQRCARWLLTVHDLTGQDAIPLTHELLATLLGVHRPTVTLVLGALQRAGLIEEERGRVVVHDPRRLEAASCGCHRVMRQDQRRLLGY